jgi:3-methyladenine DNA glycosylase AlkD
MLYEPFLRELESLAEPAYAEFNRKLMGNDTVTLLGVRTPILRKLAKKYQGERESIFTFPDDYYEVRFIKLTQIANLPWEEFITTYQNGVPLICNWALCDSFIPKCIAFHKDEFALEIERLITKEEEFTQRFALVSLLHFYVEEHYFPLIERVLQQADFTLFYVHMAAAWLIAEVITKDFERGLQLLSLPALDKKTHNKAITKATESFRVTPAQKQILKNLKV